MPTTVTITKIPSDNVVTTDYADVVVQSDTFQHTFTFSKNWTVDRVVQELSTAFAGLGASVSVVDEVAEESEDLHDTSYYRYRNDDDLDELELPTTFETVDGDLPKELLT